MRRNQYLCLHPGFAEGIYILEINWSYIMLRLFVLLYLSEDGSCIGN